MWRGVWSAKSTKRLARLENAEKQLVRQEELLAKGWSPEARVMCEVFFSRSHGFELVAVDRNACIVEEMEASKKCDIGVCSKVQSSRTGEMKSLAKIKSKIIAKPRK